MASRSVYDKFRGKPYQAPSRTQSQPVGVVINAESGERYFAGQRNLTPAERQSQEEDLAVLVSDLPKPVGQEITRLYNSGVNVFNNPALVNELQTQYDAQVAESIANQTPAQKRQVENDRLYQNYFRVQDLINKKGQPLNERLKSQAPIPNKFVFVDTRSTLPTQLLPQPEKQQPFRGRTFEDKPQGTKVYGTQNYSPQAIDLLSPEGIQRLRDYGQLEQNNLVNESNPTLAGIGTIGVQTLEFGAGAASLPVGLGVLGAREITTKGAGALISIPGELAYQTLSTNPIPVLLESPSFFAGNLAAGALLGESPKLISGTLIPKVTSIGKEYIPRESIVIPEVISGEARFPTASGSKEVLANVNKGYNVIGGKKVVYSATDYPFTPIKGRTIEITGGRGLVKPPDVPAAYASTKGVSEYFLRIENQQYDLFGSGASGGQPKILAFRKTPKDIPNEFSGSLTEAQAAFGKTPETIKLAKSGAKQGLLDKTVSDLVKLEKGEFYVSPAAKFKIKGESEVVTPVGGQFKRVGLNTTWEKITGYSKFTKINGKNVPLYEMEKISGAKVGKSGLVESVDVDVYASSSSGVRSKAIITPKKVLSSLAGSSLSGKRISSVSVSRVSSPKVSLSMRSSGSKSNSSLSLSGSKVSSGTSLSSVSSKSVSSSAPSFSSVSSSISSSGSSISSISSSIPSISSSSSSVSKSGSSSSLSGKSISGSSSVSSRSTSGFSKSISYPSVSKSITSSNKSFRKPSYSLSKDISRLRKSREPSLSKSRLPTYSTRTLSLTRTNYPTDRINLLTYKNKYPSEKQSYSWKNKYSSKFGFRDIKSMKNRTTQIALINNNFNIRNIFKKASNYSGNFSKAKASVKGLFKEKNKYTYNNDYNVKMGGYSQDIHYRDTDLINKRVIL